MQKKKSANFGLRCVCKSARRPVMHFAACGGLGTSCCLPAPSLATHSLVIAVFPSLIHLSNLLIDQHLFYDTA